MGKYFRNIWLGVYTVLVGLRLTLIHLFAKNVTVQYPDEDYPIPDNARNRLFVDMDDCNGCNSCKRACPVNCITVDTIKAVAGDPELTPLKSGGKRGLWVPLYSIDFAKCCFCGLCTEVCPTNTIFHTKEFEYSAYDRNELLYKFSDWSEDKIKEKKAMFAKAQAEKKKAMAAKKAAEAKKAPEAKKAAEAKADDKKEEKK